MPSVPPDDAHILLTTLFEFGFCKLGCNLTAIDACRAMYGLSDAAFQSGQPVCSGRGWLHNGSLQHKSLRVDCHTSCSSPMGPRRFATGQTRDVDVKLNMFRPLYKL